MIVNTTEDNEPTHRPEDFKPLNEPTLQDCPQCKGTGWEEIYQQICPRCAGEGEVP